jgi:hypothetical protein
VCSVAEVRCSGVVYRAGPIGRLVVMAILRPSIIDYVCLLCSVPYCAMYRAEKKCCPASYDRVVYSVVFCVMYCLVYRAGPAGQARGVGENVT